MEGQELMLERLSGIRSQRTILSDHMPSLPGKVPVGTCGPDLIINNYVLFHYKNVSIFHSKYMTILPTTLAKTIGFYHIGEKGVTANL